MFTYKAGDDVFEIVGSIFTELLANGGVRPHRLPYKMLDRIPTNFMRAVVDSAAGVRVRFSTTGTNIRCELRAHPIAFVGSTTAHSASLDLVLDGEVVSSKTLSGSGPTILDLLEGTTTIENGETETVVFDGLSSSLKTIELWLPHTALVDVLTISSDAPITSPDLDTRTRWLHHGSSISHCLEATRPTATWPAVAAMVLDYNLIDLAFAGNAQLDQFVARTIRDSPADLITLKLGINVVNGDVMRMRAFEPAVHGFIDTIRDGHAATPIVIISPIICPIVETRPGPTARDPETGLVDSLSTDPIVPGSLTLESIRAVLKSIVTDREREDPNISYLDGRRLFDLDDVDRGLLPDQLHPNEEGYSLMGYRFAEMIAGMTSSATEPARA